MDDKEQTLDAGDTGNPDDGIEIGAIIKDDVEEEGEAVAAPEEYEEEVGDEEYEEGEGELGEDEEYEDWRDAIEDEKIRAFAERFASPVDMAKAAFQMRQNMSKQISVPGEDATDEEIANFNAALGVPDDPGDYTITPPGDYEITEADAAVLEMITPIAQEAGVPAQAFDELASAYLEINEQMREDALRVLDDYQEESASTLSREWGNDYTRNLELSNRFADTGGDRFVDFLSSTELSTGGVLGDHPEMVRFLAEKGSRFMAEGQVELMGTRAERSSAQEQIDGMLRESPVGTDGYKNPQFQRKLQGLYDLVHGNERI